MPPSLDMKTVVVMYLLINYASAYHLLRIWLHTRPAFPGLGILLIHYACTAVGVTMILFRAHLPTFLTITAANSIMFFGISAFVVGMGRLLGVRVSKAAYAAAFVVFTLLYLHYTYTDPDLRMRTIVFAGMLVPISLHTMYICLRPGLERRRRAARGLVAAFALFAVVSVLRVHSAYLGPDIPGPFTTSYPDSFFIALECILWVLVLYSVQAMTNDELLAQARENAVEKDGLLKRLERLATRDHLTNIWNRRHIETFLDQEIERHKRYGQPFCVMLCDIDHFKAVNDEHGHDAGDKILVHVTSLLTANIRDMDGLGRWGGEEFLIVAPGMQRGQAVRTADRLRAMVASEPAPGLPGLAPVTLSCGVAEYAPGACADDLIKQADQALYKAKETGRNRVESWSPAPAAG